VTKPDWIRRHERQAERYGGYLYPWRSTVAPENGEDAYSALVREHLRPGIDIVEAGCGHGSDALLFGSHVRSYLGYDAVEPFVAIARRRASEAGLRMVAFVVADSSPKRSGRVPAHSGSVDLIISRRGPSNFILDAKRVCRPGAVLLQVCYLATPMPEWNDELPPHLRMQREPDAARDTVHGYLARAGLALHSSSLHDVEERFEDPVELLRRLAWDRDLEVSESEDLGAVSRLFRSAAVGGQLCLRHRRFVWKAIVP
jgi:SAM-dependent methyltransferase